MIIITPSNIPCASFCNYNRQRCFEPLGFNKIADLLVQAKFDFFRTFTDLYLGEKRGSGWICMAAHPTRHTDLPKQPIRTRYLGHVTGYQPIREQYFLIRSVPGTHVRIHISTRENICLIIGNHTFLSHIAYRERKSFKFLLFRPIMLKYIRNRPKQVNNQSELVI
eukprot:sb/3472463/